MKKQAEAAAVLLLGMLLIVAGLHLIASTFLSDKRIAAQVWDQRANECGACGTVGQVAFRAVDGIVRVRCTVCGDRWMVDRRADFIKNRPTPAGEGWR